MGTQRGDWDFREAAWQYLGGVDVIAYERSPSDPWDAVPYGGTANDPRIEAQQRQLARLNNAWVPQKDESNE